MGTETKISIAEMIESRILVERTPDAVGSTHKILHKEDSLDIVKLDVLTSTISYTRPRCPSPPITSENTSPKGMSEFEGFFSHSIYADLCRKQ
jgi:hypothetical protein